MRSIYRIRGVILASIGVLLGVMLAVSPGRALAESLDVLTIESKSTGVSNFFLDETVQNQITVTLPLLPGLLPNFGFILQLMETDPLTGALLVDANGLPIISDNVVIDWSFLGQVQVGSQCDPSFGCFPIFADQYAQSFTLISDSNLGGGGLGFVCCSDTGHAVESGGAIPVGTFGSLGQVFVTSDIDARNVPEPSTWLLLLLGCGVAGLAAWQRKRASELP
jgi:hypothetical protein